MNVIWGATVKTRNVVEHGDSQYTEVKEAKVTIMTFKPQINWQCHCEIIFFRSYKTLTLLIERV